MSGQGSKLQEPETLDAGSGEASGTTYGSNVSGSRVHSLAVGDQSSAFSIVHEHHEHHHQHGLSFTEAGKLFGLLFEQNFPRLAEAARAEARRRVDEFAATFTRVAAAQGVSEEQLGGFAEPDVQFALTEAIQAAARRDDQKLRDLLARLLVGRLNHAGGARKSIVLSEAIAVAGKLTPTQLRIVTVCFITMYVRWNPSPLNWATFNGIIERGLAKFADTDMALVDLLHIEYTGCGSYQNSKGPPLWERCVAAYPALFPDVRSGQPGAYEAFLATLHRHSPQGLALYSWLDQSEVGGLFLTPVGMVLAMTAYEQLMGEELAVDIWPD